MRDRASSPLNGMDLAGAARDCSDRAERYAGIYGYPGMQECLRLLHRNPWAAPALLAALRAELVNHPELARDLKSPLF